MDKETFLGLFKANTNRAQVSVASMELWVNGAEPVKAQYRSDVHSVLYYSKCQEQI